MKTRWHIFALALVAFAIGWLFLQEPGFGDDLTYWSFAFDLHERGLVAWQRSSFHDLRWPVWGVCWLLQTLGASGLPSYYGEPLLYLAGGSVLAFVFARKLTNSTGAGWVAGIGYAFHPLLDSVSYRPMPDLSEGVWGAAIMLAWWTSMTAETRSRAVLSSGLAGVAIFIIEANRVTGAFIVPVLVLFTLLYFPRRFGWLILAGCVAAALYAGECFFYKRLFGDWLHDLTANAGNKGAKGTEFPHPWALPFRFIDTLWKGNPLAPIYCLLGLAGVWASWRREKLLGRVIVLWFASLYLLYACAPQSVWPWRPLVRDADRFLAALAVPMSALAAAGLLWVVGKMRGFSKTGKLVDLGERVGATKAGPIVTGAIVILLLLLVTTREDRFDASFVPEMRRFLQAVPDGTKVFSHKAMREIIFLVDADSARRFQWTAPNEIMDRSAKLEAQAAGCTEFWYARKLLWLTKRKQLEKRTLTSQPPLGSYLDTPERDWVMTRLFARADTPDLIFYHRREADSPPTAVLGPDAPEWQGLIPALPARLDHEHSSAQVEWKIPENLKGRLARIEFTASSNNVEGLVVRLHFRGRKGAPMKEDYLLKPYLYAEGGKEFFALPIPANAESCLVHLKLAKGAKQAEITSFRALVESAPK